MAVIVTFDCTDITISKKNRKPETTDKYLLVKAIYDAVNAYDAACQPYSGDKTLAQLLSELLKPIQYGLKE